MTVLGTSALSWVFTQILVILEEEIIQLPRSDDQHAHRLHEHQHCRHHQKVHWLVHVPVALALTLLFHIPISELDNVCHEGHHNRHLNPMEEIDKTPVDISRRYSENCPNEDRPTSGTHKSRDSCA